MGKTRDLGEIITKAVIITTDQSINGIKKFIGNVVSTSTTTGTVIVEGGVGVSGSIYAGNLISALGGNSTNWNAAFGWGNHAGLYALTAHGHTWSNTTEFSSIDAMSASKTVVTGGGVLTVSATFDVSWGQRFIIISNGNGAHFATGGFFDIICPTSGTITGVGGAANKTATAAGIPLNIFETLYYILPIGSNNTSLVANFRVASYTGAFIIPYNWIKLCTRAEGGYIEFATGTSLRPGTTLNTNAFDTLGMDISGPVASATTITGLTATIANLNTVTQALGTSAFTATYVHPVNHPASIITQDASNRFVTDTEKNTWNAKQAALNGTGLVRMAGTTVSYDNASYQVVGAVHFVGTTSIANNRASLAQTLTGVSIDGNSATATTLQAARLIYGQSFNGSANVSHRILMDRSASSTASISWYQASFNAWQDYMGPAGTAGHGYNSNITPPSGVLVTSWGKRSFIENTAGYGWTWESAISSSVTPLLMAEISSVNGNFRTIGSVLSQRSITSGLPDASGPSLGSGTLGQNAVLSGNGLYGMYTGISSNGDVWMQSQRNDASTTTYNIKINPSGGSVFLGSSGANINSAGVLVSVSFTGAGTGLTGTAASLSIGGNASTATVLKGFTNVTTGNWSSIYDNDTIYKLNVYGISTAVTGMQSVYGTVLGISGLSEHDKTQLIFNGEMGGIQYRKSWYSNSAWGSLRTLWDTNNFNPSLYLPLTGGIVSGELFLTARKLKIVDTLTAGLVSEVSGQLINYGTNYAQLGERDVTKAGGFFRMDTRTGYEAEFLNVKFIPANGSEQTIFKLTTSGDVFANNFYSSSDIRLKSLVEDVQFAELIPAITYTWKDKSRGKKIQTGYSAQEVQKYMPNAVNEDSKGILSVNYIQVLVAKVQELEKQLKNLKHGIQ